MKGTPVFGPAYYQEFAPGIALDESILVGMDESVDTSFDHYDRVLKIVDSSSLHPEGIEFKYYAYGIGEITEQEVLADGQIGTVSELYRQGSVGGVDPDDSDDRTLALRDLREGRAVKKAAEVKDLDASAFAGDGSPMQVTFVRGKTDTADALGAYLYDTATGEILSARILVPDLSDADAGDATASMSPSARRSAFSSCAPGR